MEQRSGAICELHSQYGLGLGPQVMCDVLGVVVKYRRVLTGVHRETVVVDEAFATARWGTVELVDRSVSDWTTGRVEWAGGSKAIVLCFGELVKVDVCGKGRSVGRGSEAVGYLHFPSFAASNNAFLT